MTDTQQHIVATMPASKKCDLDSLKCSVCAKGNNTTAAAKVWGSKAELIDHAGGHLNGTIAPPMTDYRKSNLQTLLSVTSQ